MTRRIEIKGVVTSNDDQWIYDWFDIESVSPRQVNKWIDEAADDDELEVIINSPGGDVYAGSEIYTALMDSGKKVTVKIVGIAASAASVIAMAGNPVLISPTAQIMIHNVSSGRTGDYRDHAHESDVLKNWNKSIANAYALKSGLPESELLSMMNKETWLNAQEAVEKGFADEIMFDDTGTLRLTASAAGVIPPQVINKLRNQLIKMKGRENEMDKIENQQQEHQRNPQNNADQQSQASASDIVAKERKRLQEIDAIAAYIDPELVKEAKYGPNPMTAQELAFKAMQTGRMIHAGVFDAAVQANAVSGAQSVGAANNTPGSDELYDLTNLADVNKVFRALDTANLQKWAQRQYSMIGGRI